MYHHMFQAVSSEADVLTLNTEGIRLAEANKIHESLEVFRHLVCNFPDDFNTWSNLGVSLMRSKLLHSAEHALKKALALSRSHANADTDVHEGNVKDLSALLPHMRRPPDVVLSTVPKLSLPDGPGVTGGQQRHKLLRLPRICAADLSSPGHELSRKYGNGRLPFIVTEGIKDWKALHKWSREYLLRVLPRHFRVEHYSQNMYREGVWDCSRHHRRVTGSSLRYHIPTPPVQVSSRRGSGFETPWKIWMPLRTSIRTSQECTRR